MTADRILDQLRALPHAAATLDALRDERGVHAVGGAVRDVLLGRDPAELDLVVCGDAAAVGRRAARRLGGEVTIHERFGTATVRSGAGVFDLASTRRETYPTPGALPEVQLGASLHEDLARRDFSVNAIAVPLTGGAVVETPGGLGDLEARRLRVLHGESFVDDPTRLLRLCRYQARLGFAVERGTAQLVRAAVAAEALDTVSAERAGRELRLLCAEPQPAALAALAAHGLDRALLGPRARVDPDLIAVALGLAPADAGAGVVALAACLLDVAHAEVAGRLGELGFPAGDRDRVVAAAGRAPAVAAALRDAGGAPASALAGVLARERAETVALAGALAAGTSGEEAARTWLERLRHVRLAIGGRELEAAGISGPAVGIGLRAALAAALDGRAPDAGSQLHAALEAVRRERDDV